MSRPTTDLDRRRARAWQMAARRLVEQHRHEFDDLYARAKAELSLVHVTKSPTAADGEGEELTLPAAAGSSTPPEEGPAQAAGGPSS